MIRLVISSIVLSFLYFPIIGQVDSLIINEVGDFFELKNLSSNDVDPSDLFIIYKGTSRAMNSISAICAFPGSNRVIDGNSQQAFRFTVSHISGELILSKTETIASASDIISYVRWGDYDSTLESFAVSAGKWESGSSGPSTFMTGSLEYNDNGFSGENWIIQAVPSPCRENFGDCDLREPNVSQGDSLLCLCDNEPQFLSISFGGNTADSLFGLFVRDNNIIVAITQQGDNSSFEEGICLDSLSQLSYILLGHDGEIANLEVGQSIDDLVGCFLLSDKFPYNTVKLEDHSTTIAVDDIELNPAFPISICRLDQEEERLWAITSSIDSTVIYVFDENDDIIGEYAGMGEIDIDYSNLPAGTYKIVAEKFAGERSNSLGNSYLFPSIEGCLNISSVIYDFILDEGLPNCSSSTSENLSSSDYKVNLSDDQLSIYFDEVNIPNQYFLELYNLSGSKIYSTSFQTESKNVFDVNLPNKGLYILKMHNSNDMHSQIVFNK